MIRLYFVQVSSFPLFYKLNAGQQLGQSNNRDGQLHFQNLYPYNIFTNVVLRVCSTQPLPHQEKAQIDSSMCERHIPGIQNEVLCEQVEPLLIKRLPQ